jgi:predicted DsbA family dithiol-disulfide isomerase
LPRNSPEAMLFPHQSEVASKARHYGVRSVPAIVVDGKLAGRCAGRGPDEHVLRSALV